MKKLFAVLLVSFLVCACADDPPNEDPDGETPITITDISLGSAKTTGTIAKNGEVDLYRIQANDANRIMQIKITSNTLRPDVDLLATLYEIDGNKNKIMITGDHAPDDGINPADITLKAYIDTPKELRLEVRDLLDNDSSDNPYFITASYEGAPDGNGNFEQAVSLTLNGDTATQDAIGFTGDIDCFTFLAPTDGIYDVLVQFNPIPDTQVRLSIDLYDEAGNRIQSRFQGQTTTTHLLHYLTAGTYRVLIDDEGRDDFDNASIYSIQVSQIETDAEMNGNDTPVTATLENFRQFDQSITSRASLDYVKDQDWYHITRPEQTSGLAILDLNFTGTGGITYQINLYNFANLDLATLTDLDNYLVFSHNYIGGATQYEVSLKLDPGDYYFQIKPKTPSDLAQSAPYTFYKYLKNVYDLPEIQEKTDSFSGAAVYGNNTIGTADEVPHNFPQFGKISFRGDQDWYFIDVPESTFAKIFSIYFETPSTSMVEYTLWICRYEGHGNNGSVVVDKKLYNQQSEEIPTQLKTSFMVPAANSTARYFIKISDYQGDDGDDVEYTLTYTIENVLVTAPVPSQSFINIETTYEPLYLNETAEDAYTDEITLDYNALNSKTFKVNESFLRYNDPEKPNLNVTKVQNEDGTTTLTFPWIAGYIDFQGDQDWMALNLTPLNETDTNWYYDIEVEFHAPASEVEQTWAFYPDRNNNGRVAYLRSDYDGFIACAGDTTIDETDDLFITTPEPGDDFWVNQRWQGKTYFSFSDFNYIETETGEDNHVPDEDWSYKSAYFFRLTLTYHPGVSYP